MHDLPVQSEEELTGDGEESEADALHLETSVADGDLLVAEFEFVVFEVHV